MSLRKFIITACVVLVGSAAVPTRASADWLLTPYIGGNWNSQVRFTDDLGDFTEEFESRLNYGVSLAWMGAGIAGFEIDASYSPNFFERLSGSDTRLGDSNVAMLMGNIVLGAPIGGQGGVGLRPYVAGGVGIIRSRITDPGQLFDVSSDDWAFNAGGGVTAFLADNFGLRGDVRYFRGLRDNQPDGALDVALSDLRFWRWSVGATLRF
jgi:hypothetical protein